MRLESEMVVLLYFPTSLARFDKGPSWCTSYSS